MIELQNVRRSLSGGSSPYVEFRLDEFSVERGSKLAICGPSGCGKTTLLRILAGLVPVDEGRVVVGDRNLAELSESERDRFRGAHIGIVHQNFQLLSPFSAIENVQLGLRFGRRASKSEERKIAEGLLDQVGLSAQPHSRPSELSAGEKQRVAIARALAGKPPLVLADEPTAALDPKSASEVFDLLLDVCETATSTLLVVTHDLELAAKLPSQYDGSDLVRRSAGAAG
ncbi:MAG: ABC transporter ATP-binding protein [Planctomycetota bacterium]